MENDLYKSKPPKKQGLQYSLNLGQNVRNFNHLAQTLAL